MKIKKNSLVEIAIERIKSYIAENNLEPGEKFLSESELIQKLDVSRTVVREAIIALQSIGILTVKPGEGMFIASSKAAGIQTILTHHYETYGIRVKELLEIRKILELGALRLIIENDLQINVEKLVAINNGYQAAIHQQQDLREIDSSFHKQLIKETKNESFFDLSNIISQYFTLVNIDVTNDVQKLELAYHEHQEIIDALVHKDLMLAHSVMTKHFEPVFAWINQERRG